MKDSATKDTKVTTWKREEAKAQLYIEPEPGTAVVLVRT
jgi:hypothetical protein